MIVVHAIPALGADLGGPSRSVPELCDALCRRGVHVRVVTQQLGTAYGPEILPTEAAVEVRRASAIVLKRLRLIYGSRYGNELRRAARDAHVIHSHGLWMPANHDASAVARALGVAHMNSPRGMLEAWSLRHKGLKKRVAWVAFAGHDARSTAAFHATSESEAASILATVPHAGVHTIPNGVDVPKECPRWPSASPRRALFLSRISPKKGVAQLVEAWASLGTATRDWQLIIAGNDEDQYARVVQARVRELGIHNVEFVGPVAEHEKWSLIASCELFLLPTMSENFGIVIAEALASGRPVLTTRGAPWPQIEVGACGWWIDLTREALRSTLAGAITRSAEELQAMGFRGRELVMREFTWAGVAAKMEEAYATVVKSHRAQATHGG